MILGEKNVSAVSGWDAKRADPLYGAAQVMEAAEAPPPQGLSCPLGPTGRRCWRGLSTGLLPKSPAKLHICPWAQPAQGTPFL